MSSGYFKQKKLLEESSKKAAEIHNLIFNEKNINDSKVLKMMISEFDKQNKLNPKNVFIQNEYYNNSYGINNIHNNLSGVKIINNNNYSSNQSRATYSQSDNDFTYSVTVL